MEKKSLQLYFTDNDGAQKNFLGDVKLTSFSYSAKRMGGAPTIEGTINYPECLDDKWDASPYVIYNSEKFILLTKPSSSKSNDSVCYRHDVTFVAQRIVLENVYFLDVVTPDTDTAYKDRYRSNSTEFSTFCDIREFVARLNDSLIYSQLCKVTDGEYDGYHIVLDEKLSTEPKEVTISSVTIAEAMQEIHNTFGLNYYWVGKTCYVGDVQNDIEEVFEYGAEGGLLVVGKENSNERIVTRISGHGGSENIPWYYPNDNEYGVVTYEADGAVVADIDSKKLVDAVGTYNGMTIRLCANDMAGTEYSYELSDADIHEAGEYFEEKYDEERGNYQNCAYVKVFRTIVKMPKGGRIDLSDAGADYTYGGSTGLLLEQSPVVRTITVSQIEYFGQNRNDYSTVYGTEQIICTDREIGVSTTHEVISEAFYLIEIRQTFRYVSKAWRENAGVRSLTIADFEEEYGKTIFSYTPVNGEYYWLTANGQRVAYDKAGVTLASIPNLRYLESVYSWGVVTPADSYHRYIAMSVENEISTGYNPVTINLTGRIWTTPSQNLMPSCYRDSIGAERFMNAVNEKYPKGDGFYTFSNVYDAENPHEYIENHEDISPSIKYITNADGENIAEILDVAFDELDNDLYADDGSNESELIHSYFYIKLKRMDGENGFNIFQSASVKKAMSIHLTSGNCASCEFEIGTHSRVKTDGTGYDFYNPVQTDGNGNLLKVHDVSDSGFMGDYINHELDPDSSTHGYDPANQNTSTNEVWIAVRKDNSTFGVVMPNTNNNYKPNAGDSFVISGIDLPKSYILAAEKELDKALLDTMERSNVEKFNPSATFSRVFLATHEGVAKRLNENARIRIRYNDVVYPLYVSDYTVKTDNSILYNISLTLVTDLSLQSSTLQNNISAVETNIINVLKTSEAVDSRYFVRRDKEGTINTTKDFKKDIIVRQKATVSEMASLQYNYMAHEGYSLEAIRKNEYKFCLSHLEVWDTLNVKNLIIDGVPYTPPKENGGSGDCRFDEFFEVFYVDNNPVIRAKYDLCSIGDISAFGYIKTELPSASVVIEQLLTSGTEIARINGTTIYAPAGGSDVDLSDYVKKEDVRTFSIYNSDGTSLLGYFNPLGGYNQEMRLAILTTDDLEGYVQADDVKTMKWSYYDAAGNKQEYTYNPLGENDGELDFTAGLVSAATYNEHVADYNTFVEKFDSMFELTEDGKIKAKMSFYSTGDISAYGDADSQIPSAEVSVIPIYKEEDGILIATINGTEIYAPEGGSDVDLTGYATKQWVNNNFLTESELNTWIEGKGYATNSALAQAINGALVEAKSYADGKFNYASITEALYLTSKNSDDASEFYPAFINMRGSQYAYIDFYTNDDYKGDDYTTATDYPVRLITSHLEPGVLQLTSGRYGVGTLKIGNAYLTYDSDNNALMVSNGSGGAVNLVATGDVAAFSGLGSGFDTLTDLTLTNKLTAKDVQATNYLTAASARIVGTLTVAGGLQVEPSATFDVVDMYAESLIIKDSDDNTDGYNGIYFDKTYQEIRAVKYSSDSKYIYIQMSDGSELKTFRISATEMPYDINNYS